MSRTKTSVLLFSGDKEISLTIQNALKGVAGIALRSEETSVAEINGRALDMAAKSDIVMFATDPDNAADLSAIKTLNARRDSDTVFLALADSDISLSRARALSDAGVDDVLPYPMSDEELSRQIEKWLKKLAAAAAASGDRRGVVLPVVKARGGIGSTTVAVNLADSLMTRKSRFRKEVSNSVVIVDLDVQFGTVGDFLDVDPQEAFVQMARGGVVPDALWVEQTISETPGGLKVLTAPEEFMPLDSVNEAQIAALIDTLSRSHDYVVVDMPRALVAWVEPVMAAADEAIFVTDTTVPSIRATRRLIDFFRGENPTLETNVVINHEKKPMVQAQHHKEAARVLEQKFEHWLPHDPKAARLAIDYGKPLSEVAPRSDLSKSIAHLAKSITKAMPAVETATH